MGLLENLALPKSSLLHLYLPHEGRERNRHLQLKVPWQQLLPRIKCESAFLAQTLTMTASPNGAEKAHAPLSSPGQMRQKVTLENQDSGYEQLCPPPNCSNLKAH